MKARDTVMGLEQREIFMARAHKTVAEYLGKNIPDIKLSDIDDTAKQICGDVALEELEAQAEISFKAGIVFSERAIQNQLLDVIEASKKAGIGEVMEFADGWCPHHFKGRFCELCWQAQRKLWGINEDISPTD